MEPEKDIFEQWAEEREKKSWIVKKLRFISLWWNNDGRYMHTTFKRGVKSVWYWLPIIWKDRHWDSHYIFEIMKHKLSAQANYISNNDRHTRSQEYARTMRLCVKLMGLVQEEFYSSEYFNYHKTKHWFEDVPDKPGYSSWESKIIEENFNDYFKKYPLIYRRVLAGEGVFGREGREDDNQIVAMNIGRINHDRARKLLFKLMEQNLERWGD
jgi:hypothetical protein